MEQISKILLFSVLCLLFSKTGFSQESNAEFTNIDFYLVEEKILVSYDLKAKSTELFEIALEFVDLGTSQIILPKTLEGDVGPNIKGGKGKQIYWDVFKDLPNGIESEIRPQLKILKYERIFGGPANALKSVPVPGLGDFAVKDHREMIFKPYIKTVLAYGLVGFGVMQKLNSNKYYDDYLNSENPEEWIDLYDKANASLNQSAVLIGAGAAIWLSDIVWVAVRGAKNNKENKYRFAGQVDQKVLLGYDQFGPNIKWIVRF